MITNHITITLRNLLKNKVFSFINIFGLSVGITACLLVLMYVSFELSYDRFHNTHQILIVSIWIFTKTEKGKHRVRECHLPLLRLFIKSFHQLRRSPEW